jgi:hypothetical protein
MDNGNPQSLISWTDFIIGYGAWLDPTAGEAAHLPGHNSSYKRDILLGYGARLEALLGADTMLHQELREHGYRLYVEPAAKTFHVNFTRPSRWIPYLLYSGRLFAAERSRHWSLPRRAMFSCGAWLIPLVRLKRSWPGIRRYRPDLVPRVLPALFFALTVDALGQWLGYTLGAGQAGEKVAHLEFHREGNAYDDPARLSRRCGAS